MDLCVDYDLTICSTSTTYHHDWRQNPNNYCLDTPLGHRQLSRLDLGSISLNSCYYCYSYLCRSHYYLQSLHLLRKFNLKICQILSSLESQLLIDAKFDFGLVLLTDCCFLDRSYFMADFQLKWLWVCSSLCLFISHFSPASLLLHSSQIRSSHPSFLIQLNEITFFHVFSHRFNKLFHFLDYFNSSLILYYDISQILKNS